jgi:Histidine kinase-like ATPase domain
MRSPARCRPRAGGQPGITGHDHGASLTTALLSSAPPASGPGLGWRMQLTATCEPAVIRLPGRDPAHARDARRRARVLLAAWGLGELASLGELVVSELVANAVCHGEAPVWMRVSAGGGVLRVEVHDGGSGRPVRRHPASTDEWGRGLELLDALIGLHGGERGVISDPGGPGKTVYVELSLPPAPAGIQ